MVIKEIFTKSYILNCFGSFSNIPFVDLIDKKESHLIIATGGIDGRQYYVEVFREIKTVADMPNMDSVMLRARFNSHRHMKLFYFKSDDFETLNAELEEDHDGFAEWLHTNPNIKWEIL